MGLCACWFLYNYFIGFSDGDMSSAHNMTVANFIAIAYCVVGLYIDAKIYGFSRPFKMFNRWIKKDAEDALQPVVDVLLLEKSWLDFSTLFFLYMYVGKCRCEFFQARAFLCDTAAPIGSILGSYLLPLRGSSSCSLEHSLRWGVSIDDPQLFC